MAGKSLRQYQSFVLREMALSITQTVVLLVRNDIHINKTKSVTLVLNDPMPIRHTSR